jgi:hypothetical protein
MGLIDVDVIVVLSRAWLPMAPGRNGPLTDGGCGTAGRCDSTHHHRVSGQKQVTLPSDLTISDHHPSASSDRKLVMPIPMLVSVRCGRDGKANPSDMSRLVVHKAIDKQVSLLRSVCPATKSLRGSISSIIVSLVRTSSSMEF